MSVTRSYSVLIILLLCCALAACGGSGPKAGAPSLPESAPAANAPQAETLTEAPFYIEIQGMLLYRERLNLAPNIVCVAVLTDRTDERAVKELDRVVIPGPLHIPMRFSLNMEGYKVDPGRAYAVEAFVFAPADPANPDPASGRLLLRAKEPVPVLTRGGTAHARVELVMRAN